MPRVLDFSLRLRAVADTTGLSNLERSLGRIATTGGRSLRTLSSQLENLGPQFTRAGRSLSIGLTAPLAALGTQSVRTFAEFDNGFRSVATLFAGNGLGTQETEAALERLRQGLVDLNLESGQGFETLNQSLFDTISAGVPAEEALTSLTAASRLAIAGQTDVSTATDGLTAAFNAFGIEASQAESVAARFFQAQQAGRTTIAELSGGIGLVAANASAAGVSFDELLGATSAITLGGVSTSMAFAGIRAALAGIARPTMEARMEAERLGIAFDATALRTQGLEGFIDNLVNSPNFGPDSITRLFGSQEAQGALNALINQVDTFRDSVTNLGDTESGINNFGQAVEVQSASISEQLNRLQSLFSVLANEVGTVLAPVIGRLVTSLTNLFTRLRDSGAINTFTVAIAGVAAAIGPVLVLIGRLLPLITRAIGLVGNAARVFGALAQGGNLLSGSFRILINIAQLLFRAFTSTLAVVGTFIAAFARIQMETGALTQILTIIGEILGNLGSAFLETIGVSDALANSFFSLQNFGMIVGSALAIVFNTVVTAVSGVLVAITGLIRGLNGVATFLGRPLVSDATLQSLDNLEGRLAGLIATSNNDTLQRLGIRERIETTIEPVVAPPGPETANTAANAARDALQAQLNAIPPIEVPATIEIPPTTDGENSIAAPVIDAVTNDIMTATMQVGENVNEFAMTAANSISQGVGSALGDIVNGTETVGEAFRDLASNIISSLTQQALQGALSSIGSAIAGGFSGGGQAGFAEGGLIPGFSSGGRVQRFPQGMLRGPGTGTSDSILARVSNGEFISDARTTRFFGADFFRNLKVASRKGINPFAQAEFATGGLVNAFNNAQNKFTSFGSIPRYEEGGIIDRSSDSAQFTIAQNINIQNEGTGKQVTSIDRDEITGQIRGIVLQDIQANGPISQNIQGAFGIGRQGSN